MKQVCRQRRVSVWLGVVVVAVLLGSWGRVHAQESAPGLVESAYLVRLINEARVAPLAMLERAGIDPAWAREAMGADAWILDHGLPPLSPNDLLAASAQAHLQDMVQRLYYSTITPEGLGPWDRAVAVGYVPVAIAENLGLLEVVTFVDGREAVWTVFRQWLLADITAVRPEDRKILVLWARDAGTAFQPVTVLVDGVVFNAYLAVCDLALPEVFLPMIVGSVRTKTADGIFLDPWQVLPSTVTVRCRSQDGTMWWEAFTDPLGGYRCPAGSWESPVIVEVVHGDTGEVLTSSVTAAGETHVWLDVFL